uniref:glycosyltransferase family 1 protein n=1 Tax=Klebsiella pneumoniae TaxID=573 RepID=UPI0013D4E47A
VRVYSPTIADPAFAPAGDLVSVPSVPIPGRSEFRVALGLPGSVRADVERFAPNIVHVSAPICSVPARRSWHAAWACRW